MNCINCNKETTNPKFCSRSCAATYNNQKGLVPKRKAKGHNCKHCNKLIFTRNLICEEHKDEDVKQKLVKDSKICTKCNIEKPNSEYYFKGKKNQSPLQSECKVCFNLRMSSRWKNYKEKFAKLKNEDCACSICGYNKCVAALDFHHLDSKEKDFAISKGYSYSFERIKKELDKCILVCSNCHREIHSKDS